MEIKWTDDNGSVEDLSSLLFQHALGKTEEAKVSKRQSKLVNCFLILIRLNFYTLSQLMFFKLFFVPFYSAAGEEQEGSP